MKKLKPIIVPKKDIDKKLILETLAELLPTNHPKKAVILEKLKEV